MERVMESFLKSVGTVLGPKYRHKLVCDTILVNIRVVLCDKVLNKELRRVLVEAISPLAKVSAGLCEPHELEDLLQPAFKMLAAVDTESLILVNVVEKVDSLTDVLQLLQQMNNAYVPLTPPDTPSDDEDPDSVLTQQALIGAANYNPLATTVSLSLPTADYSAKQCMKYSRAELMALRNHRRPRLQLPSIAYCIGIIRDAPTRQPLSFKRSCSIDSSASTVSQSSLESDEMCEAQCKVTKSRKGRADNILKWEHDLFNPNY